MVYDLPNAEDDIASNTMCYYFVFIVLLLLLYLVETH